MTDYLILGGGSAGCVLAARLSEDPRLNGCAERFIRTLKENLLWVRTFQTVEELRLALLEFRQTCNTAWLLQRHGFITPAAVRQNPLQPAARAA